MTNWRAVGIGIVVLLIAGVLGLAVPLFGQIGAGIVGGFVAGYLAGGGLLSGGWHGLLAGSVAGIAFSALVAVAVAVFGLAIAPEIGLLGGAGVFVVGAVLAVLLALDSALAGAIGGVFG